MGNISKSDFLSGGFEKGVKMISDCYRYSCDFFASMLGRAVRVRHRDLLTSNGSVRLRYMVVLAATALVPIAMNPGNLTSGQTPVKLSYNVADVSSPGEVLSRSFAFADNQAPEYLATLKVVPIPEGSFMVDGVGDSSRSIFGDSEAEIKDIGDASVNVVRAEPAPQPSPQRQPKEKDIKIGEGDVISLVLQKAGLSGSETREAVNAMQAHFDPKKIKPGQKLHLRFDPEGEDGYQFAQMVVDIDVVKSVVVESNGEKYSSHIAEREVHAQLNAKDVKIKNSIYGSALQAGLPSRIIANAIKIYSWDVDFQRDIRPGDSLELMYETFVTDEGDFAGYGDIVYANLSTGGEEIPIYRFDTSDGNSDYFEADGKSIRKALMRTPVDGARMSSGFGMRKHPILGYTKMHKGQDFAAPRGTPIYAAGDGVVEKSSKWSSYGNYIRIRHNSDLKTAYAHLKNFAKGISPGKRVKQGEVIGYVGTTGRSTGPHLHYEVIKGGTQVNPATVKLPKGKTLKGTELAAFKKEREEMDRQFNIITGRMKVAETTPTKNKETEVQ